MPAVGVFPEAIPRVSLLLSIVLVFTLGGGAPGASTAGTVALVNDINAGPALQVNASLN
jgi:hypothetical protein